MCGWSCLFFLFVCLFLIHIDDQGGGYERPSMAWHILSWYWHICNLKLLLSYLSYYLTGSNLSYMEVLHGNPDIGWNQPAQVSWSLATHWPTLYFQFWFRMVLTDPDNSTYQTIFFSSACRRQLIDRESSVYENVIVNGKTINDKYDFYADLLVVGPSNINLSQSLIFVYDILVLKVLN